MLSWSHFACDILRSNFRALRAPYRFFLVVTKSCQSRCTHCKIWREKPEDELTLEELTRLAKASSYLKWLNISGGEPTDRDDLPAVIAAFKKNCPNLLMVNFTTNGLEPERIIKQIRQISELKIPKLVINVSIDGPQEIHDSLRGVQGNFDKAIITLKELRLIPGITSKASMTLFQKNKNLIDQTLHILKSRIDGFSHNDLHLNLPHQSSHFYHNEKTSIKIDQEIPEILRNFYIKNPGFKDPLSIVEKIYRRKTGEYLLTGKSPVRCSALETSVYISEKGEIYPCTIWDKSLGSLRDNDFNVLKILKDEKALKTRKEIDQQNCPQCWTPCEAYPSIMSNLIGVIS